MNPTDPEPPPLRPDRSASLKSIGLAIASFAMGAIVTRALIPRAPQPAPAPALPAMKPVAVVERPPAPAVEAPPNPPVQAPLPPQPPASAPPVAAVEPAPAAPARAAVERSISLGPWSEPIDPDGDCRVSVAPGDIEAQIRVPGTTHLLSAHLGRINAPRVLREIRGDFTITALVDGTDHPAGRSTMKAFQPYHGAGILLWVDAKNYIRLESATELRLPSGSTDFRDGKPYRYANFECWADGKLVSSRGQKRGEGPAYLRLERVGDKVRASFGPDTLAWAKFESLDVPLPEGVRIGLDAVSSASNPLEADFREVQIEPIRPVPSPPTPNE